MKITRISVFICVFVGCVSHAWSMTVPEKCEFAVAIARLPGGILANSVNLKKNKTRLDHALILLNDVLRLANESLSVVNKRGELDFHSYDYCWIAYDSVSLMKHIKNCFNQNDLDNLDGLDDLDNKEISKPEKIINFFHSIVLPSVEAISAAGYSSCTGGDQGVAINAVNLHWVNTFVRLVDNAMMSEAEGKERSIWIFLCCVSYIELLRQLGVNDWKKFEKGNEKSKNESDSEQEDGFPKFKPGFDWDNFGWNDSFFGLGSNSRFNEACKTLGVDKDASFEDISSAYRKLARQYHPDKNPGDVAAAERFKEIGNAMDVVRDKFDRK